MEYLEKQKFTQIFEEVRDNFMSKIMHQVSLRGDDIRPELVTWAHTGVLDTTIHGKLHTLIFILTDIGNVEDVKNDTEAYLIGFLRQTNAFLCPCVP